MSASIAVTACANVDDWDPVFTGIVRDVDQHVHRAMKRAYLANDVEQVLGFYAEEIRGQVRPARAELMGRFERIERAAVVLTPPVEFGRPGEQDVSIHARTFLYGTTAGGWLSVIEDADLVVRQLEPGRATIVSEAVHGRKEAFRDRRTFTDVTVQSGITLPHEPAWLHRRNPIVENISLGCGAACGDFDQDGFEDLYLVNGLRDRLYRNRGDGTFEDATRAAGLLATDGDGQGAAFGDLDDDGWPDLVVTNLLAPSQLWHNRGGRFEDVTAASGLPSDLRYVNSICMLDYDRDGDLDLFLVGSGDFYEDYPDPIWQAENGTKNHLFRNDGGMRFIEVTDEAGVGGTEWGLAAVATDYDLDGDVDLYVANDFGLNRLYRNEGDGTFEEVAEAAGASDRGAGMGVTAGDVDGDGDFDFHVSNMYAGSRWIVFHDDYPLPIPWYLAPFRGRVNAILDEMTRGDTMLLNRGDGTFEDVTDALDMRNDGWAWGCLFLDHDNDADLDLYVVNGMVSNEIKDDL